MLLDLISIDLAMTISLAWSLESLGWPQPIWILILSALWLIWGSTLDLYNLRLASQPWHSAYAVAKASIGVSVAYFLLSYFTSSLPNSRFQWFFLTVLAVFLSVTWRLFYGYVLSQPQFANRAIIVGAGWAGATIAEAVREHLTTDYHLVGFVDDDPDRQEEALNGIPIIGQGRDLRTLAESARASQIILAITHDVSDGMFRALLDCQERGVEIIPMPTLYEELTGKVAVEHIGRKLHLLLPLTRPATRPLYLLFKRLVDLTAGMLGLALMGILVPLVWLGNRLMSPGPIFYRQSRVGQSGRLFQLVKFRTMIPNAEEGTGAVWAKNCDPRITPLGNFLRKTRIDELPQFINVLRGEMSLVGPRPERPEFVRELDQQIPFYRLRHSVKPGLTGWAQIKYRYGRSVEDAKFKLQYDLYYIKRRSVYLELLIILKTVGVVLKLQGT